MAQIKIARRILKRDGAVSALSGVIQLSSTLPVLVAAIASLLLVLTRAALRVFAVATNARAKIVLDLAVLTMLTLFILLVLVRFRSLG